jgi:hypothetical protein
MSWSQSKLGAVGRAFAVLVVAAQSPETALAGSNRPCGGSIDTVAKVVEWSVDGQASGNKIAVTVAIKLDDGMAKLLPSPSSKVATIGGYVRFAHAGAEIERFWLANPDRPLAVGAQYSHRYLLEPGAGALALAHTPKQQVSALVCVATWTYDNGGQVIVN